MGFSSWDCRRCKHPLLSKPATSGVNEWMTQGVAILPGDVVVSGEYDGYARLNGNSIAPSGPWEPDVYHMPCWTLAKEPTKYKGGSKPSRDQGWFFDQGRVHQTANPIFKTKKPPPRVLPAKKPTTQKAWEEAFKRMTKEDPALGSIWSEMQKAVSLKYRHQEKGHRLFRKFSHREEGQAEFVKMREAEVKAVQLQQAARTEAEAVLGPYRWTGRFFTPFWV